MNVFDIYQISENEMCSAHLGYYVDLDSVKCKGFGVLIYDFMDETVQNGAFSNTEQFEVRGTAVGHLSMDTVRLLLEICEHLKAVDA